MPDLRSVTFDSDRGGREALPSREPFLSRHCGTAPRRQAGGRSRPRPMRTHRPRALITLATGSRRAVPSMHFSRPGRRDRPAHGAVPPAREGRAEGRGGALGRPPPPCTPLSVRRTGGRGGVGRGGRVDAQADMPLDEPRAQVAFKDSMIRGILQFTLRIAFRCVLHRCKSQDIRC